jgi:hypothetical protein
LISQKSASAKSFLTIQLKQDLFSIASQNSAESGSDSVRINLVAGVQ